MAKKKRQYAKPRRVRPANNAKYCRQLLEELREELKQAIKGMREEMSLIAAREKAIVDGAHGRLQKLERKWDRLANYVAELARQEDTE